MKIATSDTNVWYMIGAESFLKNDNSRPKIAVVHLKTVALNPQDPLCFIKNTATKKLVIRRKIASFYHSSL